MRSIFGYSKVLKEDNSDVFFEVSNKINTFTVSENEVEALMVLLIKLSVKKGYKYLDTGLSTFVSLTEI